MTEINHVQVNKIDHFGHFFYPKNPRSKDAWGAAWAIYYVILCAVSMVKFGLLQTALHADNRSAISSVSKILRSMGKKETDIACLPEQWLVDNVVNDFDETFAVFKEIAREFSMCIVPGAFYHRHKGSKISSAPGMGTGDATPQMPQDATTVTAPVISDSGDIAGMQDKIHPFDSERGTVTPGSRVTVFESGGTRFGIMICYDTVFPAVAGTLVKKGAQAILTPAKIVKHGVTPWHTYVQARALENRIPVIAANVSDDTFGGNSMIAGLSLGDVATVDLSVLEHDKDRSQYVTREIDLGAYDASRRKRQSDANPFV